MAKQSKQNKLRIFRKVSKAFWVLYILIFSIFAAVGLFGEGWDKISSLIIVLPMLLIAIPLLFIHVLTEFVAAVQRKDSKLRELYTPLLVIISVIFVLEIVGLVMYEKRRSESPNTERIAQNVFSTAGFQAFEPSFIPAGLKLEVARSESLYLGEDKPESVDSVYLVYSSYRVDKPTWVKSAIRVRQIDVRDTPPITSCFIAEGYHSYGLQEVNNLYDCRKINTRNGTVAYRYSLKDEYKNSPNYTEINNYYLIKDDVWFDLEPYGDEKLKESEVMQIIDSFVPGKD